ncbi:MAG: DUF6953 family protein [bacterium]
MVVGTRLISAREAREVAKWMLAELRKRGSLYQPDAAEKIERRFGRQFVDENADGGTGIDRRVLEAFRAETGKSVVWDRFDLSWRWREKGDEPGRRAY